MATQAPIVGKLRVPVEMDLAPFERDARTKLRQAAEGMARTTTDTLHRGMRRGARRAGKAVGEGLARGAKEGMKGAATAAERSGEETARRFAHAQIRRLKAETGKIRAASEAALITPEEAAARGEKVAQAHNEAMLRAMRQLESRGKLTRGAADALGNAMLNPQAYGRSLAAAARRTEEVHIPLPRADKAARRGDEIARRFTDAQKRRLEADAAKIRAAQEEGLMRPEVAEHRAYLIAQRYNRAMVQAMRQLETRGKLSRGAAAMLGGNLLDPAAFARQTGQMGEAASGLAGVFQRIGMAAKLWLAGIALSAVALLAAGVRGLAGTLQDARAKIQSALQLVSVSKLYGVPFKELRDLAVQAREEMQLTAGQANAVAAQVGKIAGRAGESARAQELLNAAMDLGAANGLKLEQVVEALDQTYRGMDDGLNKLGLADPGQIFKTFAASIGTTSDKLTDAQKQLAMMNEIVNAGAKVQGEYGRQLGGNLGKMNQWDRAVKDAREEIGTAFLPLVARLTEALQGPLSSAVDGLVVFLESMLDPMDRVIARMERMGAAAEYTAERINQLTIRDARQRERELEEEIGEARGSRFLNRGERFLDGYGGSGRRLGDLSVDELRQKRAELVQYQRTLNAGDAANLARVIDAIDTVIDKERERINNARTLADAERDQGRVRRDADIQAEIDANKARVEQIDALIASTGLSTAALEAERRALAARNEELEQTKSTYRKPEEKPEEKPPAVLSKEELNARAQAAARLRDRIREAQQAAQLRGFGFQPEWEDRGDPRARRAPQELTAALREILQLEKEITEAKKDQAKLGAEAPAGTAEAIALLEQQRDAAARYVETLGWGPRVAEELAGSLGRVHGNMALILEAGGAPFATLLQRVQQSAHAVREAQRQLDVAKMIGDAHGIAEAQRAVANAEAELRAKVQAAGAALQKAGLEGERLRQALEDIEEALRGTGLEAEKAVEELRGIEGVATAVESLAGGLDTVLSALDGVAERIPGITEEFRDMVRGVRDLARGVAELGPAMERLKKLEEARGKGGGSNRLTVDHVAAAAQAFGAVGAIVGGLVAIGQSIWGQTEQQKELIRVLKANAESVERLRLEMAGRTRPTQNNLERAYGAARGVFFDWRTPWGKDKKMLDKWLQKYHQVTLAELESYAEKYNIDLYDDNDNLIRESFTFLAAALQAAGEGLDGFGEGLREKREEMRLERELSGKEAPAEGGLQEDLALLEHFASGLFKKYGFDQLDLSTPEGIEQARALLQKLYADFRKGDGSVDLEDFTAEEFREWLSSATGNLNRASKEGGIVGEQSATQRMNVSMTAVQGDVWGRYFASLVHYAALQTQYLAALVSVLARGAGVPTLPTGAPSFAPVALPSPDAVGGGSTVIQVDNSVHIAAGAFPLHVSTPSGDPRDHAAWETVAAQVGGRVEAVVAEQDERFRASLRAQGLPSDVHYGVQER